MALCHILPERRALGKYKWYLNFLLNYNRSSSCRSASTDNPDLLSPFVLNACRSRQVFQATSCIGTELSYIGSSWSSYLCSSMWRGPQKETQILLNSYNKFILLENIIILSVSSDDFLKVRDISCHVTSSKSAWKSTSKCTWVCWRVWWSPGAIRWPVADPGCGSRTQRRPASPKRPKLDFRRSATTSYPSLNGPLLPQPEPTGLLRLVLRREYHQHDLPQHQSQPDAAIHRVFAEHPPALVEKACSQFQIRIEAVIASEGYYIE